MEHIKKHLNILGHKVKDQVTGLVGVATSVSFDLYGCIQVIVHPGLDKDGKAKDSHWFDISRLSIVGKRVMPVPAYIIDSETIRSGAKGPAEKPPPAMRR